MTSERPSSPAFSSLASGFPQPDRDAWLAEVDRTLKGAPIALLTRRSLEGVSVEVLYDAKETRPSPARGQTGWDIRTLVREPDALGANDAALGDLAGGANSILLALDPSGVEGVAVGSADDLSRVLQGIVLDAATVALDAGYLGPQAADWLASVAKGAPAAKLSLHLDPLSALARSGQSPGPIESHLIAASIVAARLAPIHPNASLFLASGRAAHEAGGGEATELALATASALAYAKALVRAGLSTDEAFERIVLGLSVDTDVLLSIAKLRAARRVWDRLAGACGAGATPRIEARSSGRMLTGADPWTNMVRLTAAGFAGAVGGADAMVLGAFTDALGAPTTFARRQARNIQLVLQEEASLGRVIDPAAGSGAFEALTDELARDAWGRFQSIEAAGGVIGALKVGLIADWVAQSRDEIAARLSAREFKLLGVTDFRADDAHSVELAQHAPRPVEAPSARAPGPDDHCPALAPIRVEDLV
jgi:methylmalonyl-CoA mutase